MSDEPLVFGSPQYWISWGGVLGCVCLAALAAGLTMGLVAIEPFRLEILLETREEDCSSAEETAELRREKRCARTILPVVTRHHLLLVTLLLLNSVANEALPLFLDRVVPTSVAILLSVTFVLVFGEIIPAAIFTGPSQLSIAARLVPFVRGMMFLLFPIAWPISKALDYFLGHDDDGKFRKAELRALVNLHGDSGDRLDTSALISMMEGEETSNELSVDEVTIINGAMDIREIKAGDVVIPLARVFMLNLKEKLTHERLVEIVGAGHSRLPVFDNDRKNIRGLLLVKKLIVINPQNERAIQQLGLRQPLLVTPDISLLELLNKFQGGKSHMALVTSDPATYSKCITEDKAVPEDVQVLGILTLEDVMERLIQEPIADETDADYGVSHQLFKASRLKRLSQLAEQEAARRNIKLAKSLSQYDVKKTASPSSSVMKFATQNQGTSVAASIGKSLNKQRLSSLASYGSLESGKVSNLNLDESNSPLLPKHPRR